ncbi:MAG TPA: glycosyltransferase family 39 protein, partial [Anaerolineae bacterium]
MTNNRRDLIVVFAFALIVRVMAALPQAQPGYMDAAYYTVGGQQLVQGFGFNDPYIWNYLDQPTALPHPSHLYWMPLPSILVAMSQSIFGVNYRAAQLPFVLLSSLLPLIAYAIAWRVSSSRRQAWLAALLTIFSPFYLPYWGVPESFAPFAVFGSLALLLGKQENKAASWRLVIAGACAGLAHLSRADGILLLIPILALQVARQKAARGRIKFFIPHPSAFILISLGYLLG